jgi:hypothetical protein
VVAKKAVGARAAAKVVEPDKAKVKAAKADAAARVDEATAKKVEAAARVAVAANHDELETLKGTPNVPFFLWKLAELRLADFRTVQTRGAGTSN